MTRTKAKPGPPLRPASDATATHEDRMTITTPAEALEAAAFYRAQSSTEALLICTLADALAVQPAPVDATQAHFRADMARRLADAGVTQARLDLAAEVLSQPAPVAVQPATPAAKWRVNGEPDPHGTSYDCERAKLAKGDLTDDELANAIYMADRNSFDLIVWQAAAKDRIRWLSRALEGAVTARPVAEVQAEAREALQEAVSVIRDLYITADNDREEGYCEGVSAAEAAILALIGGAA